jgi:hypothetical protein
VTFIFEFMDILWSLRMSKKQHCSAGVHRARRKGRLHRRKGGTRSSHPWPWRARAMPERSEWMSRAMPERSEWMGGAVGDHGTVPADMSQSPGIAAGMRVQASSEETRPTRRSVRCCYQEPIEMKLLTLINPSLHINYCSTMLFNHDVISLLA